MDGVACHQISPGEMRDVADVGREAVASTAHPLILHAFNHTLTRSHENPLNPVLSAIWKLKKWNFILSCIDSFGLRGLCEHHHEALDGRVACLLIVVANVQQRAQRMHLRLLAA